MYTVNPYKDTEMRRYRRLRCLGRALRCLEAGAALIALSWSSTRLPCAARASGEAIRATTTLLLSPGFVFLLGNAIVILLFTKFRLHLAPSSDDDRSYNEFLEARDIAPYFPPPPAQVVFEDKEVCVESRRALGRSRSAGGGRRRRAAPELLRRTESTEVLVEGKDAAMEEEEVVAGSGGGEEPDEFRRTVEEFIKKHQMFQREETTAIASSAGPPEPEIIQHSLRARANARAAHTAARCARLTACAARMSRGTRFACAQGCVLR